MKKKSLSIVIAIAAVAGLTYISSSHAFFGSSHILKSSTMPAALILCPSYQKINQYKGGNLHYLGLAYDLTKIPSDDSATGFVSAQLTNNSIQVTCSYSSTNGEVLAIGSSGTPNGNPLMPAHGNWNHTICTGSAAQDCWFSFQGNATS